MRHMKMYRFMSDIGAPVCKQDGRSVSRNIEGVYEGMSGRTGMNEIRWCAIGDSFTYLNDHLSETGYRVKSGYLDRTCEKVGGLRLMNHGINGSETKDWLTAKLPEADIYTVLLGTNDWRRGVPMGTDADFMEKIPGTILGNLGCLTARIRETAPKGRIVIMTPVERGDYVCIGDPGCQTMGSYRPQAGQRLCDIAEAIARSAEKAGLCVVDLHKNAGFTAESVVRFKRLRKEAGYHDYVYPGYVDVPYDWKRDPYPYPVEAVGMTFDGLHPSDEGNEAIAKLLAEKLQEILGQLS